MNPELQKGIMCFEDDRRIFERNPVSNLEVELLKEQAYKATCQEIVDLYKMLQNKCIQGRQVQEFNINSVTTPNTY